MKANLLIDGRGVVVGITLTAANIDERDSAYDVLQAIEGLVLGDKGYTRPPFKADCETMGIDLQTPLCQNMIERWPHWWLKLLRRVRKRIEPVIQLTRATLQLGENPSARCLAFDQSGHAQALDP